MKRCKHSVTPEDMGDHYSPGDDRWILLEWDSGDVWQAGPA